jgi:hypothetical protein
MARHVERRLDSWEWHRCGRCGGEFPAHGSYVLHDCEGVARDGKFPAHGSYVLHDCEGVARDGERLRLARESPDPPWPVLRDVDPESSCPMPVRLDESLLGMAIIEHFARLPLRHGTWPLPPIDPSVVAEWEFDGGRWDRSPFRDFYEQAALFEMSGADMRRYMATFAHPTGIEP